MAFFLSGLRMALTAAKSVINTGPSSGITVYESGVYESGVYEVE